MASVIIDTLPGPQPYTQTVELDSTSYLLEFRFNTRDGKWRLSITFEDTLLIRNIPLVETTDLTANFRYVENLPPGTFQVIDLDGLGRDPDTVTFGDRTLLQYDEVA